MRKKAESQLVEHRLLAFAYDSLLRTLTSPF